MGKKGRRSNPRRQFTCSPTKKGAKSPWDLELDKILDPQKHGINRWPAPEDLFSNGLPEVDQFTPALLMPCLVQLYGNWRTANGMTNLLVAADLSRRFAADLELMPNPAIVASAFNGLHQAVEAPDGSGVFLPFTPVNRNSPRFSTLAGSLGTILANATPGGWLDLHRSLAESGFDGWNGQMMWPASGRAIHVDELIIDSPVVAWGFRLFARAAFGDDYAVAWNVPAEIAAKFSRLAIVSSCALDLVGALGPKQ